VRKLLFATLAILVAGCSTSQQSALSLSPETRFKLSPATASYVYVPEEKYVTYTQSLRLAAYPAGINTSTPTYTRNFTMPYPCPTCLSATAVDPNGHVYVAGVAEATSGDGTNIEKLSSDLSTVLNTISLATGIVSIATDSSGNLWALRLPNTGSGVIYKFDSSGVQQTSFNAPTACSSLGGSISLDGSNNLFLGCAQTASTKVYERISGSWSLQFTTTTDTSGNVAAASGGQVWVTTQSYSLGCGVAAWTKTGGAWSVTSSQILETYGGACYLSSIAVDPSGTVYTADNTIAYYSHGYVFEYVPTSALNPPWYTITTSSRWLPIGTPSAH
jgi:hypothetical protein